MKKLLITACLTTASLCAQAGEFRGGFDYAIGSVRFENELSSESNADAKTIGLGGKYFLDEAGPFFGLDYAQIDIGDFETNGIPLGIPDQDSERVSFTAGYRGGNRGTPQLYGSATYSRSDSDQGDDLDTKAFEVGLERTRYSERYQLSLNYESEEDIDIYGIGVAAVFYLFEDIGFRASAAYAMGDGKFLNQAVDVSSWSIGAGLEYRFIRQPRGH